MTDKRPHTHKPQGGETPPESGVGEVEQTSDGKPIYGMVNGEDNTLADLNKSGGQFLDTDKFTRFDQ